MHIYWYCCFGPFASEPEASEQGNVWAKHAIISTTNDAFVNISGKIVEIDLSSSEKTVF